MSVISREPFELALRNITSRGDTDVFPLPFESHVLYDRSAQVVPLLESMSDDFTPVLKARTPYNYSALAAVGYNGFRWATQIDPLWNAYFLGATLSLADQIEGKRVALEREIVFSHRYSPDADGNLFDREAWTKFTAKSIALAEDAPFVVAVDIADFYGRVYHHRIENQLRTVDRDGARTKQIVALLTAFSNGPSYGLPIGGPAARILSELLLDPVDRLLLTHLRHVKFTRYADDYRFFVPDMQSAYEVIGFLSEKLQRNEGLSLQRSKTRIMTGAEYLNTARPIDPRPGSAAKFLSLHLYYDPYSSTADEDYEELAEQLSEFDVLELLRSELSKGRVDQAVTRRLVSVLRLMGPVPQEQAVASLLENLETLAPVLPHVMRAIRDCMDELPDEAQESVCARLRSLIEEGHHLAQVDVNLAYMLRVLAKRENDENRDLLIRLYTRSHGYGNAPAPNIQRDTVLTLARWRTEYWLHDLKPTYDNMHPWVKRAFWVSSFALGDEGRHWRKSRRTGLTPFDAVVADWASEKHQIPEWVIPT